MLTAEHCRARATECEAQAEKASLRETRWQLKDLGRLWREMAADIEQLEHLRRATAPGYPPNERMPGRADARIGHRGSPDKMLKIADGSSAVANGGEEIE